MTIRANMVEGIPASEYWAHADRIRPFLEGFSARDPDGMTVDDFERDILARDAQVWCINKWQACCLTRVTRASVRIERCAGVRRREWQDDLGEAIENWARALGKKRVIATVRPGWSAYGKSRGYREIHREMRIDL